ncbi:MAG TPA: VWA domain-containing protein [Solirubrobacteraceae bacterium]|nr:VWA domain-containing protein [Solirubrobacteraceae bacterium]
MDDLGVGGHRKAADAQIPSGEPGTIDVPALAAAFGRALRQAGVPVTPERSAAFARALALRRPRTRTQLYWTARAALVSGLDQLSEFDRVFGAIFGGLQDPAAFRGDRPEPAARRPGLTRSPGTLAPQSQPQRRPPAGGGAQATLDGPEDPSLARRELALASASSLERLGERDFAELDPGELAALRQLMHALSLAPPPRPSRRRRRDRRRGRVDVRATLRAGVRTGGDPARAVRRRRVRRPRRLVALCDVSGSMEPYTRAYLQLLHAAVAGAGAEAFVFATRLTRVTRALSRRDADAALARAAEAVRDWSGGTRLGEALRRFNDDHGRRGMARGAVVLIISDGWERGDPALVAREMGRLSRLAHRIVWVNPRRAAPRFEPLSGGMAAALPFCDAFVSGHSAAALAEVVDAVGGREA